MTPIISTENENLAANLSSTFSRTRQIETPNSARRRRPVPDLSRSTPTPSHGAKMSLIFQDAAVALQDLRTPQIRPSSNTKKPRLPILQIRTARFGGTGHHNKYCSTKLETPASTHTDQELPSGTNSDLPWQCPLRGLRTDRESPIRRETSSIDPTAHRSLEDHLTHLPVLANLSSPTPNSMSASDSRRSCGEGKGREPISSGFATPSALHSEPAETPKGLRLPEFEHWLPWSSSVPGSDGGEHIPSPRVPLALSPSSPNTMEHHGAKIEGWLNDIKTLIDADDSDPDMVQQQPSGMGFLAAGTVSGTPSVTANKSKKRQPQISTPKPTPGLHKTLSASSNKENVSPVKSTPSPTRLPVQYPTSTPSRFHNRKCDTVTQPTGALHFAHPLTPKGHLNKPPKRKKARVSLEAKPDPSKSGRDFTICENQVADALAQLSPDVELRRKGRRPKRERCVSYWDEDILLGESRCEDLEGDGDEGLGGMGRGGLKGLD